MIAGLFGGAAEAAPPPGAGELQQHPEAVPDVRAQYLRLRRPLQQRAGDRPGPHRRRLGGGDRQASLPQRRLQRGGAARLRAGLHDHGPRRKDARSSIATTCAACRTASPHSPSPATGPVSPQYFSVDPVLRPGWRTRSSSTTTGCPSGGTTVRPTPPECFRTGTSSGSIAPADGRPTASTGAWSAPSMPLGPAADAHDLQLLSNGDHLIGAYVKQSHVDTRPYGPQQRHRHQRRAAAGESQSQASLGLEEPAPHLAGRNPAALVGPPPPGLRPRSTGTRSSRLAAR